jgi:hypothetical protein
MSSSTVEQYAYISGDVVLYLIKTFNNMNYRAKEKKIEFKISVLDLIDLFDKQNGKCAITGRTMTYFLKLHKRYPDNICVSRVDKKRGFTKDNIRMICTYP